MYDRNLPFDETEAIELEAYSAGSADDRVSIVVLDAPKDVQAEPYLPQRLQRSPPGGNQPCPAARPGGGRVGRTVRSARSGKAARVP